MSFFEVRGLTAGYGKKNVIKNADISCEKGEIVGLMGANGCGKTTLLKAMCTLIPSNGKIACAGRDVKKMTPREIAGLCGYIPQKSGINIEISVTDAVLMGFNHKLRLLENPGADMRRRAEEALSFVGLAGKGPLGFQTLSEGQKQLCILARTVVCSHELLFFDEPESAVDFGGRYRLMRYVQKLVSGGGRCAIVALHDIQLALNFCTRIVLIKDGEITESISCISDETDVMGKKLSRVFGELSVKKIPDRSGKEQFVIIKEDEDGDTDEDHVF